MTGLRVKSQKTRVVQLGWGFWRCTQSGAAEAADRLINFTKWDKLENRVCVCVWRWVWWSCSITTCEQGLHLFFLFGRSSVWSLKLYDIHQGLSHARLRGEAASRTHVGRRRGPSFEGETDSEDFVGFVLEVRRSFFFKRTKLKRANSTSNTKRYIFDCI